MKIVRQLFHQIPSGTLWKAHPLRAGARCGLCSIIYVISFTYLALKM